MSVPTDSVLKRHYEQMSQAGSAGSGGSAPASGSDASAGQGGLFGWLKKLFCG